MSMRGKGNLEYVPKKVVIIKSADPLRKYKKAAIEIYTLKVEKRCQARAVLMNHVDKDLHPQCSLSSF